MDSEIMSATLPDDGGIRAALLAQLRERFGVRLAVWNDCVFVFPASFASRGENVLEFSAAERLRSRVLRLYDPQTRARASLSGGKDFDFCWKNMSSRIGFRVLRVDNLILLKEGVDQIVRENPGKG